MRVGFQLANYQDPRTWLLPLLRALTEIDRQFRVMRPRTASVYGGGVVYLAEGQLRVSVPCPGGAPGECIEIRPCECWQDTPTLLCAEEGDCEDLACDRAAELQLRGVDCYAHPIIPLRPRNGRRLIHIIVAKDGRILEDPSARLGMPVPPGYPVEGDRLPSW
jgi:hypothetical protein